MLDRRKGTGYVLLELSKKQCQALLHAIISLTLCRR